MEALNRQAAPVEKYLDHANLPIELLEHANGVISTHSLYKFMEVAVLDTGILDLGFWASCVPIDEYGDFGSQIIYSPSLRDAINTFCNEAYSEDSGSNFYLDYRPTTSWFRRANTLGTPIQQQQAEIYDLMMMIRTTQAFLGSDWHPSMVRLMYTKERDVANNDFFTNLNIEYDAQTTEIAIGTLSLATPTPISESVAALPNGLHTPNYASEMQSTEPLIALRKILSNSMRYIKHPSIKHTADMAGVSTRSLQRFLLNKGTTHTKLIDQVRYELALPLLKDKAFTITEIAYELGYSSVAHFSRAFRRISGMAPTTYRHNLKI